MSIEILDCLERKRDIGIKNNTQPKYGFHVDPRLNKNEYQQIHVNWGFYSQRMALKF